MPTFTPPTVEEGINAAKGLFRYFRHRQGISIGVLGSTVTQLRFPYQEDMLAYDVVYLGGYVHNITTAQALVLTNAGYGAYIT
jgi:hypothetical protein